MPQTTQVHHEIHALPPRFIQETYWRYNKIKTVDLEADQTVIDFGRGLTDQQRCVLKPVKTLSAARIQAACKAFRNAALGMESDDPLRTKSQDVAVYEHEHFPGLQIAPSVLPPETQVLFVSQVMHKYLANAKHKTNVEAEYDINFPEQTAETSDVKNHSGPEDPSLASLSSFFSFPGHVNSLHRKPATNVPSPLKASQFLSKKLRWLTLGSQYDWPTRSYPLDGPTAFPSDLHALVTGLFPDINPESGVCLLYGGKDFMPVHRDVSEQCQTALASFSFGCDGIFVVAKGEEEVMGGDEMEEEKKRRTVAVRVRSGDCVVMDGESRWAWHAMPVSLEEHADATRDNS